VDPVSEQSDHERLVSYLVEKTLAENWYRISRYDNPEEASMALWAVAREITDLIVPKDVPPPFYRPLQWQAPHVNPPFATEETP
jgi:hypothetical protein